MGVIAYQNVKKAVFEIDLGKDGQKKINDFHVNACGKAVCS